MATHIVFDSATEIEPEPDNDSDDGPFLPSSQPAPADDIAPSVDGADPVSMDHTPSSNYPSTEAQQVAQQISNTDGASKSFVAYGTPDGDFHIVMSDGAPGAPGHQTHEIDVSPGGSTDDTTYDPKTGNFSDTTVMNPVSSDVGEVPSTTDNFDGLGNETSLKTDNNDNSQSEIKFATNPDGSESIDQMKNFNQGRPEAPSEKQGLLPKDVQDVVKDAGEYALEKTGELLNNSKNQFLKFLGDQEIPEIYKGFDKLKDAYELGTTAAEFADAYAKGDQGAMVTKGAEAVAKSAEMFLGAASDALGPQAAWVKPAYHAAIVFGNAVVGSYLDTLLIYQDGFAIMDAERKATQHYHDTVKQRNSTPVNLPANIQGSLNNISPGNALANLTNAPLTQPQTLVSWAGLDSSAFTTTPAGHWQGVGVQDVTANRTSIQTLVPYSGPVAGLAGTYINITKDNLNITSQMPSSFIHSGSGNDAIDVSKMGGNNVLDGGTGSNFLVGGTGRDTSFVDARGATSDIWSTLANFHPGDDATMWGITPAMFNVAVADNQGAAGFTGLTLHATAAGSPTASLTLAGLTSADLTNGKLTQSFGTDVNGNAYMLIHAI